MYCVVSLAGCTQEQYTNLVDNAGGFDGWVAASLPVNK
jgi:rhodanese-related sulfurtransferase